jgi:ATP-binding cassette, subfamily B, bacterial PglK
MKRTILYRAFTLLSSQYRKKSAFIVLLLVLNSILDFLSIASFLPLIIVIINPNVIATNDVANHISRVFKLTGPGEFTLFVACTIVALILIKTALSVFISWIRAGYVFGIGQDLTNRALAAFMASDYHAFVNSDHSKEINKISNQPLIFSNNIILPLANILSECMVVCFIGACIALYNLNIILLLGVILLPITIFYAAIRNRIKAIGTKLKETYPRSLKYCTQAVEGFIEIRTSATEPFFLRRFKKASMELRSALESDHILQGTTVRLTEVIAALIICTLVAYSILSGHGYQQTILLLSIYAGASYRLIPSINRIMNASLQIRTHHYVIDELRNLSETPASRTPVRAATIPRFEKTIELREISFAYHNGPSVFNALTLRLHKGGRIAIMGNSGEGKTTLLLMLMGLIQPDRGEIIIDGKKTSSDRAVRLTSYVSQNPYILDASLVENVAFGIEPAKIDRKKARKILADMDLMGLVAHLPDGIDSHIGEKGVKLSGGQRQRIALARALYNDADILLLDEVTNQVHLALEKEIIGLLSALSAQGKTVVVVTHKLTSPEFFDVIYHLEKGRLQEVATEINPAL